MYVEYVDIWVLLLCSSSVRFVLEDVCVCKSKFDIEFGNNMIVYRPLPPMPLLLPPPSLRPQPLMRCQSNRKRVAFNFNRYKKFVKS